MLLDALEERFGAADARRVFADLREANNIEAPVSVPGSFPQQVPSPTPTGERRARRRQLHGRSARRSGLRVERASRRREALGDGASALRRGPAGRLLLPRVLRRDGARRRRVRRPRSGVPGSAGRAHRPRAGLRLERDVVPGGQPRPLRRDAVRRRPALPLPGSVRADAAVLRRHAAGAGATRSGGRRTTRRRTGPSSGTRPSPESASRSPSSARRAAASCSRTRAFYDLNTGRVDSAKDFLQTMNGVEFSFNWFYADDRDIALFSSGRLPHPRRRHRPGAADGRHRRLRLARLRPVRRARAGHQPAVGRNPELEQQARRRMSARPTRTSRMARCIAVDLLRAAVAGRKKHSLATLTGAMNKAATQDLRAARVLAGHPRRAPDRARAERARRGGGGLARQLARRRDRAGSIASSTGRSTTLARP